MTPSTVKAGIVSAVLDAGYHIKLAGGGHYNAAALRSKVAEIQKQIPAGVGITLNSIYINPRQFTFQLPLWQEMRKEGLPIEGFCVAAGVLTTEKAVEIIDGLRAAKIRHIAFRPGSVDGIRQVVNIAAANPDFPISNGVVKHLLGMMACTIGAIIKDREVKSKTETNRVSWRKFGNVR
jgi:fatty acid synthase subunit beta